MGSRNTLQSLASDEQLVGQIVEDFVSQLVLESEVLHLQLRLRIFAISREVVFGKNGMLGADRG